MHTHSTGLPIWTVYKDPTDVPGKYVVRRFINDRPTNTMYISDTLEGVREYIPEGLVMLMPDPNDDPKIVEVWL